jgi:PAS domain S-box-containing protein
VNPNSSDLLTPASQKRMRWRFIAYSSLFFITSITIFILTFSALRISDLKAEQAVASSAYMSQLMSIAENSGDIYFDEVIPFFLGTLVGDRVFTCIRLEIDSTNTGYSWPTNNCHQYIGSTSQDIRITGVRENDNADNILILAALDQWAPFDKYLQEAIHISLSAFLMGLFALLAVNFAFNRAVRRPLKILLDELLEALAGADGNSWSSDPNNARISRFSGAYDAMLERAKELRRKEEFWRAITDSSHDCVISIDRQGCIIDFNVEAESNLGYQRGTVLGLQLSGLIVPERHLASWKSHFIPQGEKTCSERQIMELQRADGSEFQAEFSVREIVVHDEQFFTIYIFDATDILKRQEEFREAKNAAEEVSRAKSSFLAMMSHEIRTPLNAVHGALGLISSSKLDSSQRKFLDVGKKGAESLLLIINDILDFSRIEAGKLVLEPALFDPQQTIDDVFQVLEPRIMKKKISLIKGDGFDSLEYLIGDVSRIRQVLLNLCSNAVRFTEQGYVRVDCSCNYYEDNNTWVRFTVKDTGKGVSIDDQPRLFEEFWGQNNSGSLSNRGTGLGLPISKKLVEVMGGKIGFESEFGRGSTFWFELPLERAGPEITAEIIIQNEAKLDLPDKNLPDLQGRVLLAEDNPANQLIAQAMLERMGLQIDVVANGHEAIEALRTRPYDLVLMDVNMPGMDGIEATRVIREMTGELASIPIVAMTALAMTGDREMLLSKGMDDYVSKPVIKKELHATIVRAMNGIKSVDSDRLDILKTEADEKDSALVDREVINLLVADVGVELLPEIIDTFLAEIPSRIEAITRAATQGDFALLVKEAHPLKSSSAAIGAMRLADLAGILESAGRKQDLEKIKIAIQALEDTSDQTRDVLLSLELKNL